MANEVNWSYFLSFAAKMEGMEMDWNLKQLANLFKFGDVDLWKSPKVK